MSGSRFRSKETRVKISATLTGRTLDSKHIAKVAEANRGQKRGARTIAKMQRSQRGRIVDANHRAKISAALRGRKLSEEHCANLAKAAERVARLRRPTSLEYGLQMLLESVGLEFEAQIQFGRYIVDFWVVSHGLVFEADGMFWYHHQDKERETRRNAYLMDRGAVAVVHLDDRDLWVWVPN